MLNEAEIRHRLAHGRQAATRTAGVQGLSEIPQREQWREAAVLVPVVLRNEGVSILLTQRTAHLTAHAGQISFPGGGVEARDADAEATALRETEEEIGLPRRHVELLGRLDVHLIPTGFRVTPVVGLIRAPFQITADPNEVAEVFEVPLDFVLADGVLRTESAMLAGAIRHYWVFDYGPRRIWGATAAMLVNLRQVLR